ncbi:MAG: plasmid mobilization relaxosome protein MobC [Lachnospiraceae bacterium]|nr:plasmid mobilization relaxosome protein MobC [Lachnospiraceae bacterium]
MAKRTRTNPVQFYLNDDEQYILDAKFKESKMKSKSAFLRKLILFGFVYDVDYSYLRDYNTELGRISKSLNQIAKRINSTNNIYQEDMDEVKELMNEVWRTQKSMLLKQPLIKQ